VRAVLGGARFQLSSAVPQPRWWSVTVCLFCSAQRFTYLVAVVIPSLHCRSSVFIVSFGRRRYDRFAAPLIRWQAMALVMID